MKLPCYYLIYFIKINLLYLFDFMILYLFFISYIIGYTDLLDIFFELINLKNSKIYISIISFINNKNKTAIFIIFLLEIIKVFLFLFLLKSNNFNLSNIILFLIFTIIIFGNMFYYKNIKLFNLFTIYLGIILFLQPILIFFLMIICLTIFKTNKYHLISHIFLYILFILIYIVFNKLFLINHNINLIIICIINILIIFRYSKNFRKLIYSQ